MPFFYLSSAYPGTPRGSKSGKMAIFGSFRHSTNPKKISSKRDKNHVFFIYILIYMYIHAKNQLRLKFFTNINNNANNMFKDLFKA